MLNVLVCANGPRPWDSCLTLSNLRADLTAKVYIALFNALKDRRGLVDGVDFERWHQGFRLPPHTFR